MAKQVLDLYMLYKLVVEKGGLVEGKDFFQNNNLFKLDFFQYRIEKR